MKRAAIAIAMAIPLIAWAQSPPQAASPEALRPLTILYDCLPDAGFAARLEQLDASPFLIVYQGSDPGSEQSGTINPDVLVAEVRRQFGATRPRWAMLDFESPFTENLARGPGTPEWAGAVETMIQAVRAVRSAFPETRWTYYNAPTVPYWFDGKDWETSSPEARVAMLDKLYKSYAPLVAALDWVSVSLYPVYDPARMVEDQGKASVISGKAWRTNAVGLARILAAGKPVIPTISPLWMPGGFALAGSRVPHGQFTADLVVPLVEARVDGIAIWTGADYYIKSVVEGDPPGRAPEKGYGAQEKRTAVMHDWLDDRTPANWSDPAIVSLLKARMSEMIVDAVRAIRAAGAEPAPAAIPGRAP